MTQFNLDALLSKARSLADFEDFGPGDFLPGLEVLVNDLNRAEAVSEDRVDALQQRLIRLLVNRLYFSKDLREHPEILEEDIRLPIEIAALPRTGSTKLHRLLAASGDFQALPMWKTHMFARIPGLEAGGEARRIQEVRDYEAWMLKVSPEIRTGHPMFTEEAEEDQWLGECTFRKPMSAIMFDAPLYAQWLVQQDPGPVYAYLHSQLQYLQWQTRLLRGAAEASKPWLLKSPDNFGCEPLLAKIFGDMRFVVTHRNPVECIASGAVMTKHFRRLYSDHYDPQVLAGSLVPMISQMAKGHLAWRNANPGAAVLDLSFHQITRDGLGAVRKVYDYLGMELSPSAERAMANWEAGNGRDKHGKNIYSLDDIGTTSEQIRAAFSDYISRYAEYL